MGYGYITAGGLNGRKIADFGEIPSQFTQQPQQQLTLADLIKQLNLNPNNTVNVPGKGIGVYDNLGNVYGVGPKPQQQYDRFGIAMPPDPNVPQDGSWRSMLTDTAFKRLLDTNRLKAEEDKAKKLPFQVPAGYMLGEDGKSLTAVPGGPADQKAQMKSAGGDTVNDVVTSLRDIYSQLDASGGITNPNKGAVSNIEGSVSSSGLGQTMGRLFGTQNQSLRNTVAQQRPLLLQAIMKATGMSAKQMDSNVELKLYLATATDPTLDVETNKRALDMIEKLYGNKNAQTIAPGLDQTGTKQPSGWAIQRLP